ncbi:MAG: hypothetical protein WD749_07195 [Phycisphaerales bacterium]
MTRRLFTLGRGALAAVALALLAPLDARAQVAALDRAPAGTPVVIAIPNLEQFSAAVTDMARTMGLPEGELAGLGKLTDILRTQGLNPKGSAAFVIAPPTEDEDEPNPVVIVPVSDFGAMVKALGGQAAGISELKIEDKTVFAKDLSGGFAALSADRARLELFDGKPGNAGHFEKLMGAAGKGAAEGATAYMVMDMQASSDHLRAGFQGFKMQMEMMAAMGGGNFDAASIDEAVDGVLRDGSALVLAGRKGAPGFRFDAALQFKEGTEYAGKFSSGGNARSLTGTIPNQPFLVAFAIDMSAPVVRQAFTGIMKATKQDVLAGMDPAQMMEKIQGMSFFMGSPPSMTNGLFLNTGAFIKSSDPKGYLAMMRDIMGKMSGREIEGITYEASYEASGAKVGEKPVDVWTMKMKTDPNNPMAEQVAMMQSVLFGSPTMSGYAAEAPGGVIVTYSKNSSLLQQMTEAATNQKGMTEQVGARTVAENLPGERVAEAYLGTKTVIDTVTPFMGLYDFETPKDLPPLGFALTTTGGGLRLTAFAPQAALETFGKLQKAASGEMDEEKKPEEKTGQPKF